MTGSLSAEIVEAIADAEGVSVEDLDFVLYDYVDAEALDRLVDHGGGSWTFSFEVRGHDVTVTDEGSVSVEAIREDHPT